jgi:hypothetical protein
MGKLITILPSLVRNPDRDPGQAQESGRKLDSGFRRNDGVTVFNCRSNNALMSTSSSIGAGWVPTAYRVLIQR